MCPSLGFVTVEHVSHSKPLSRLTTASTEGQIDCENRVRLDTMSLSVKLHGDAPSS